MTPQEIAQLAAAAGHDVGRIFYLALGDNSIVPWVNSPLHLKEATLAVVGAIMADPSISAERQHKVWCDYLEGEDLPELQPWDELAEYQKAKQIILGAAVRGVLSHYSQVIGKWPQI